MERQRRCGAMERYGGPRRTRTSGENVGVRYDYFRAADVSAVRNLMELTDGGPLAPHGHEPPADVVDAKGVEPAVTLGKLVAFVLNIRWAVDLMEEEAVWPAEADTDEAYEGPWVTALGDRARDALADVADTQLPPLAAWWVQIEEL
jgi:hypothetical protein